MALARLVTGGALPIINLGSVDQTSDIYSFYSLTKSPFVTRLERILPFWRYPHCPAANSFPIMAHWLTQPWISGVTNEVKLSCDAWWCLWCRGGSDQWSLVTGPLGAAPTCIPHSGCLPQMPAFIRLLSLLLLFVMTFNNGKFLPLINLLILVYWNAIFTNGKVLLLHNHFNPSLSQKTFMMGNFQIS